MSSSKLKNEIGVMLLDNSMSLKEIAEELGVKEKKAYSLLKSMFTDGRVNGFRDEDGQRRYRLTKEEEEKASKRRARADKKSSK